MMYLGSSWSLVLLLLTAAFIFLPSFPLLLDQLLWFFGRLVIRTEKVYIIGVFIPGSRGSLM